MVMIILFILCPYPEVSEITILQIEKWSMLSLPSKFGVIVGQTTLYRSCVIISQL